MNDTDARILAAARAAQQIGEPSVCILAAGLPITIHAAAPHPQNDVALTRAQLQIAAATANVTPNPAKTK